MKTIVLLDKYFIKKPLFRKWITRILYGDSNKDINFFNTHLHINTVKENGYLRASNFAGKSSVFRDEVSILINLSSFITNNSTFIDVGANVGLYSSTFQRFQKLYKDFTIYAFEANPDTFKRLIKTAANTDIQYFNYALSNADKKIEFIEGAVSHVFAVKEQSSDYHYKNQKLQTIQAKRLDEFEIKGNNLIIKIDVEGHEYEVLQGASGLFADNRVKVVYLDGYGKTDLVTSFLRKYNFDFYDGKTLEKITGNTFSLLAIHKNYIKNFDVDNIK